VTILSSDGQTATTHVEVTSVAPALFTMNASGLAAAYVVHVKPGNVQTTEFVFAGQAGNATPVAIDLGPPTDQAYLALFGTGIRNAAAGLATVKVNGIDAPVSYAGPRSGKCAAAPCTSRERRRGRGVDRRGNRGQHRSRDL
jgi:uncharacterized protein (TIGR03437 family)